MIRFKKRIIIRIFVLSNPELTYRQLNIPPLPLRWIYPRGREEVASEV